MKDSDFMAFPIQTKKAAATKPINDIAIPESMPKVHLYWFSNNPYSSVCEFTKLKVNNKKNTNLIVMSLILILIL